MNWRGRVREFCGDCISKNGWTTKDGYSHILEDTISHYSYWEPISREAAGLKMRKRDKGNLSSSQIMAVNIVAGLKRCDATEAITGTGKVVSEEFEWKDGHRINNTLNEFSPSNIDYKISLAEEEWLLEFKYAEDKAQPCSRGQREEVCDSGKEKWLSRCPLKEHYQTKYMDVISDSRGPIECSTFAKLGRHGGCPMKSRELYQFVRLVCLAWLKNQEDGKEWRVGLIYPSKNKFISEEAQYFASCLTEAGNRIFCRIPVEEIVKRVQSNQMANSWREFMLERYLLDCSLVGGG